MTEDTYFRQTLDIARSLFLLFLATLSLLPLACLSVGLERLLEVFKDFLVGDTRRDLNLLNVLSVGRQTVCYLF